MAMNITAKKGDWTLLGLIEARIDGGDWDRAIEMARVIDRHDGPSWTMAREMREFCSLASYHCQPEDGWLVRGCEYGWDWGSGKDSDMRVLYRGSAEECAEFSRTFNGFVMDMTHEELG